MGFLKDFLALFFQNHGVVPPATRHPVCPSCAKELEGPGALNSYRCPLCEGLWLDRESFSEALTHPEEDLENLLRGSGSGNHTFQRSQARPCPSCNFAMDNYPFGYQSDIWVDACSHGHGVWLDGGELAMVRSYHRSTTGPLSAEDRAKMGSAFLEGATSARRNLLDALPEREIRTDILWEDHSTNF